MSDNTFISKNEHVKLLKSLHKYLFWVGEQIPHKVEINGEMVHLHEFVWEMVNKPQLSDENKTQINHCIALISKKEAEYEYDLEISDLTLQDAKKLFSKTAGLMRALMDLKELEEHPKKKRLRKFHRNVKKRKVDDAKKLITFIDKIK
ncbi:MAG TPA: methyl-accepting chemotaxis protein [Methanosarcinaceae archaeon]|nr:methyl-accepting chemotaxis protein [Methanosarcinaceae archaeon]